MGTDTTVPLGQYLGPLRDHTKLIGAVTAAVVLLGLLASAIVPTTYRSTASILVTPISADPTATFESNVEVGMATEERIATSSAVVVQVADRLAEQDIEVSHDDLSASVTVSSPKESRILDLSYDASTPGRARAGAETFAQTYLAYRSQLANEDKEAVLDSLRNRIALLKEQLAEVSAEQLRFEAGSESFITVSVEKESIKSELDAQQEALANLSTLSVEVGRIISPAEEPDGPEGVGTIVVLFGSLIGGLVLGCLAAFAVAALREGNVGSRSGRRAAPSLEDLLPGDAPDGAEPGDLSPVVAGGGNGPVEESEQPPSRERVSPEPGPSSAGADEELTALLGIDLWNDRDATDNGWPSNVGIQERSELSEPDGAGKKPVPPIRTSSAIGSPLVVESDFEALLVRLDQLADSEPISCICFGETSPEASLAVGLGLAVELQARGSQVLVIDLQLDAPALHGLLSVPADPGLLDVLAGDVSFDEAQHLLPEMGDLRALTVGAGALLTDRQRTDELVNGWGMRSLLRDTVSLFQATILVGGTPADAERLDLAVRETECVVVATDQPVGRPVGQELAETLSALPTETLGLVSLDAALATGAGRGTTVPGA